MRQRALSDPNLTGRSIDYHPAMKYTHTAVLTLLCALALPGCNGQHKQDAQGATDRAKAEARYARIQALSGDWYLTRGVRLGVDVEADPDEPFVSYSVSSAGHSVIEKLFVGKPNEMTSVYYLDDGRLMMDHYCSLGNQPRMVAIDGQENEIPFKLIVVSNMNNQNDLHISSHSLEFVGSDELIARWGATEDQEPMGGSRYMLKRAQQR